MNFNITNTTTDKMTYTQALTIAIDAIDMALSSVVDAQTEAPVYEKVVEKLTALKIQTEKRNSGERKPTKAQLANQELSAVVAEVLANAADPMTVTEIMHASDTLAGLSNQKVTAVIRSMGAQIEKVPDKRVNRFRLA